MSQRDYVEKDYYKTLGVPKDAGAADIAKAYRKLARELHPDANPGDPKAEERFKDVSEAYSVLSNAEKRKEYDQVRQLVDSGAFRGYAGAGRPGGAGGFNGGFAGPDFDLGDLLGGLFGQQAGDPFGGRRRTTARRGPRRGGDAETDLRLSFEDAMAGVTTTLRVSGPAPCSKCGGTGAAPGTAPTRCTTCGGTGTVTSDQGMFSFAEPCPTCHGAGVRVEQPCSVCHGNGVENRVREVRARIPAGVRDGARIRLKGKGQPGANGAPAGDLYVNVHVGPHPLFGRRGDDLTLVVPVTMSEAALGAAVQVPTLEEPVTVKIPAGTRPGRVLRVKGRGAPKPGGGRGDLLVTVDVVIPAKLNREQRDLLQRLAATEDGSIRAHFDDLVKAGAE